jgi:hypothetical protein
MWISTRAKIDFPALTDAPAEDEEDEEETAA